MIDLERAIFGYWERGNDMPRLFKALVRAGTKAEQQNKPADRYLDALKLTRELMRKSTNV